VTLAMHEEPTTLIIQRYLDALAGDAAAEPIIRPDKSNEATPPLGDTPRP
jgi:hypothetical protein